MFDFFDKILGFIETVYNFFINMVNSLMITIDTISRAVLLPLELIIYLPSIFASAVLIIVSLSIAKTIVGR